MSRHGKAVTVCLWAIVPVKPLRRGKSRLAGVLNEGQRARLNYAMLENTLQSLRGVPDITQVLVVSRDPSALALARDYSARTLQEDANPGLNTALIRATRIAQAYSACGVIVVPADLPLLTSEIIQQFLFNNLEHDGIVISPDEKHSGTNALLVRPAGAIQYCFGIGSFHRHIHQAEKAGLPVKVFEHPALALDLDLPEDLRKLREMGALPLSLETIDQEPVSPLEAK